jgi:hypothetical protein
MDEELFDETEKENIKKIFSDYKNSLNTGGDEPIYEPYNVQQLRYGREKKFDKVQRYENTGGVMDYLPSYHKVYKGLRSLISSGLNWMPDTFVDPVTKFATTDRKKLEKAKMLLRLDPSLYQYAAQITGFPNAPSRLWTYGKSIVPALLNNKTAKEFIDKGIFGHYKTRHEFDKNAVNYKKRSYQEMMAVKIKKNNLKVFDFAVSIPQTGFGLASRVMNYTPQGSADGERIGDFIVNDSAFLMITAQLAITVAFDNVRVSIVWKRSSNGNGNPIGSPWLSVFDVYDYTSNQKISSFTNHEIIYDRVISLSSSTPTVVLQVPLDLNHYKTMFTTGTTGITTYSLEMFSGSQLNVGTTVYVRSRLMYHDSYHMSEEEFDSLNNNNE